MNTVFIPKETSGVGKKQVGTSLHGKSLTQSGLSRIYLIQGRQVKIRIRYHILDCLH